MTDLSALFASEADDDAPFEQLPDGVYFADACPPDLYFAQDAMGSSDWIALSKRREGWWWKSRHNPMNAGKATDAQNYGSALHAWMLEGRAAYESRFTTAPDPATFPFLLRTEKDIKAALQKAGAPMSGTSKWVKRDWVDAAQTYVPHLPVWDAIVAAHEQVLKDTNKAAVTATEARMLEIMVDAAFDTDRPEGAELARLFSDENAPPLAEISVLWTDERGFRRRGRIDRMFPRFDLDLKSLRGHWGGRPLELELDNVIRKHGYDIQRAEYREVRRRLYAFVSAGMEYVHGGMPEQRAWLARFPDAYPRWEWVWLFYQKPDLEAGAAPVLFPLWDDHGSDYHRAGYRKARRAQDLYLWGVERFGLDKPWTRVEPVHYTNQNLKPHILTYPDNDPDAAEPVEGEAEALGE